MTMTLERTPSLRVRRESIDATVSRLRTFIARMERRYECSSEFMAEIVGFRIPARDCGDRSVAERLPDPPVLDRERRPRSLHRYDDYQLVHQSNLGVLYAEGVIENDTLQFTETEGRAGRLELVQLDAIVYTPAGGVLETHKRLSVEYRRGSPYVSTSRYVYVALMRIEGRTQSLFRYDSSHGDVQTLHRHYFDHAADRPGRSP